MKLVNFSLSDYLEFRVHMPSAVIGFMAGMLFTITVMLVGPFILSKLIQ